MYAAYGIRTRRYSMAAPTVLLPVELSVAGVVRAQAELAQIGVAVAPAGPPDASGPPATAAVPDVVTAFEHSNRHKKSRTPRVLELFAREKLLTPTEIGVSLGNGKPLTKAQARAVMRN